MSEHLDTRPDCAVAEAEFRRLLGYPRGHEPGARAIELAAGARQWFAAHGRPWIYRREAPLELPENGLRIDGAEFASPQLRRHLAETGAERVVLLAVSAGAACEGRARELWGEERPDEYFFLETYGSAVVEHLMAAANAALCAAADHAGLVAIPHYSPGYAGWDVAEQGRLFELITRGGRLALPEPLEVLPSGMLRPKKSQLAIVGLAPRNERTLAAARLTPCERCSFAPCRYRRAPFRHAVAPGAAPVRPPGYSVNLRALRKWAAERVRFEPRADGTVVATFRFDGTTCSNLGRPLAFDYVVTLSAPADGRRILAAECGPAPGDEGHKAMCAYASGGEALLRAIAAERPLLGRPLDDVLAWARPAAPTGCYCTADSRTHKWGLALEAIHFALARRAAPESDAVFSATTS